MFGPSAQPKGSVTTSHGPVSADDEVSFIPLAMPIMFGPGAIATIIGMVSTVKESTNELAAAARAHAE
jgi:multiple antibiotic resistance protein